MSNQQARLKDNLKRLQKTDAKLAFQLQSVDAGDLVFCKTQAGELNLQRTYAGQTYFYHSPVSAHDEAAGWFAKLPLHHTLVLYVYGIGLGYYYEAAKQWLKNNASRRLVFLEEDRGVLYRLLETERGTAILKDLQVQVVYLESTFEDKTLFNELSWCYLNDPFTVSSLTLYQDVNPQGFLQLRHLLSYHLIEKKAFVEEYLQYGVAFFRNFYPNLVKLPKAYFGNGLFGQFRQVPAIICGAGPSLNKNRDQLKDLKERALLFAGSSALNALIPKGILPHFGVAIDPNQAQLPRVEAAAPHHLPFFYRQRLFHRALDAITGPRLYLTGTGGYEVAQWFEQELGLEGESLDEGHNVVNFCIEIAHALGCDPIILVGVDLAFTNDQPYADGVVADLKLTDEDFKQDQDFESEPLVKEDIHGLPIRTLWKWITESEWITEFSKAHPEVTLINATEGGLGFKHVENKTLKEVSHLYLKGQEELDQRIQTAIAKQALDFVELPRLIDLMSTWQASLDRCIELFTKLLDESHGLEKQIQQGLPYPDSLQTPSLSLLETEIEEQAAYQYLLDTFNQIYIRVHHRTIQDLHIPRRGMTNKRRALKKVALQLERLTFLKDVAQVNRALIQRTLNAVPKEESGR